MKNSRQIIVFQFSSADFYSVQLHLTKHTFFSKWGHKIAIMNCLFNYLKWYPKQSQSKTLITYVSLFFLFFK